MLDNKDKKWICDTIDKRLEKSEERTHARIYEVDDRLGKRIGDLEDIVYR